MLYDYCLNQMSEDELRNYAHHQNEIEEAYGGLIQAKNEMIDALTYLYRDQQFMYEQLSRLNQLRDNFGEFENEMREKYKDYEPKPVCYKENI